MAARRQPCRHVAEPAIEKLGDRLATWIDMGPAAERGDELTTFDLRLALCATECMPFTNALAGLGIAHFKHDGPAAGSASRSSSICSSSRSDVTFSKMNSRGST